MTLNGWRRLAVVMCSLLALGAGSLLIYEFSNHIDGTFVGLNPPPGTQINGGKATLPDGRVVDLNTIVDGESLKPWEIKWDNEPEVPIEKFIRWNMLLVYGVVLPIVFWIIIEVLSALVCWIRVVFKK